MKMIMLALLMMSSFASAEDLQVRFDCKSNHSVRRFPDLAQSFSYEAVLQDPVEAYFPKVLQWSYLEDGVVIASSENGKAQSSFSTSYRDTGAGRFIVSGFRDPEEDFVIGVKFDEFEACFAGRDSSAQMTVYGIWSHVGPALDSRSVCRCKIGPAKH